MKKYYGKWRVRNTCVLCGQTLSWHEKMQSLGCCPHCGHYSGSTICDTINSVVRPVYASRFPRYFGLTPIEWETK